MLGDAVDATVDTGATRVRVDAVDLAEDRACLGTDFETVFDGVGTTVDGSGG